MTSVIPRGATRVAPVFSMCLIVVISFVGFISGCSKPLGTVKIDLAKPAGSAAIVSNREIMVTAHQLPDSVRDRMIDGGGVVLLDGVAHHCTVTESGGDDSQRRLTGWYRLSVDPPLAHPLLHAVDFTRDLRAGDYVEIEGYPVASTLGLANDVSAQDGLKSEKQVKAVAYGRVIGVEHAVGADLVFCQVIANGPVFRGPLYGMSGGSAYSIEPDGTRVLVGLYAGTEKSLEMPDGEKRILHVIVQPRPESVIAIHSPTIR